VEDAADLRRNLERSGLGLICHLPAFVSTADLSPRIREASILECVEGLRAAALLQCEKVVIHPGAVFGLGAYVMEESGKAALDSLRTILLEAGRSRLRVCVENMFPKARWMVTPEEFDPLLREFPHVGLTLDVGHAAIQGGWERAVSFIRRFPDRIFHIHVSDNRGDRDEHLPLGVGTLRLEPILKELKGIGYDGTVTLEIFAPDRDYLRISREKFLALWERV
jgi:sugar phosphate isomerase/epimerase